MKKIILASTSSRRKQLLKKTGLKFETVESGFKEVMDQKKDPHQLARKLSLGKAKKVAKRYKNAIIIAADTFIVCKGEYLSKVYTDTKARGILSKLSGKIHLVITGITVIDTQQKKTVSRSVETKVHFKKLTGKEMDGYIKSKEPIGVAGSYRIQDKASFLVEKIEGDYYNVVGLPLFTLIEILKEFGINPLTG